jgi:hypothetical protein
MLGRTIDSVGDDLFGHLVGALLLAATPGDRGFRRGATATGAPPLFGLADRFADYDFVIAIRIVQ